MGDLYVPDLAHIRRWSKIYYDVMRALLRCCDLREDIGTARANLHVTDARRLELSHMFDSRRSV